MNICEIDSQINSNNSYNVTFDYSKYNSTTNIHMIVNYIRLKYILNKQQYTYEYDNIEYELINNNNKCVCYKLLLTKINNRLKQLLPNTTCHLVICLKDEIDNPSLFIQK